MRVEELRRLCVAVMTGFGMELVAAQPQGPDFDLIFSVPILDRRRAVLARVTASDVDSDLMGRVAAAARRAECADFQILSLGQNLAEPSFQVVAGDDLAPFLRRSWLVLEVGTDAFDVDRDGYALARRLGRVGPLHDREALLWLPALARMKVPPQLLEHGAAADLFEQVLFRVLTRSLRLNGVRMGSLSRGQRVGDALVAFPPPDPPVLVDAKASATGYTMDVDDERRLLEYARMGQRWHGAQAPIDRALIVSSSFPGPGDQRHGFHGRRRRFAAAGVALAYVRADDLAHAALALDERGASDTSVSADIDWSPLWDEGLVTRPTLLQAVGANGRRS